MSTSTRTANTSVEYHLNNGVDITIWRCATGGWRVTAMKMGHHADPANYPATTFDQVAEACDWVMNALQAFGRNARMDIWADGQPRDLGVAVDTYLGVDTDDAEHRCQCGGLLTTTRSGGMRHIGTRRCPTPDPEPCQHGHMWPAASRLGHQCESWHDHCCGCCHES